LNNNQQSQSEKIRSINTPGWDGLEAEPQRLVEIDIHAEIDQAIWRVFNTPDGQKVLGHLIAITVDQPAWTPGADPSYGYAREGQNSIIREIQSRMRRSQNVG
jgi:hypothetical protein